MVIKSRKTTSALGRPFGQVAATAIPSVAFNLARRQSNTSSYPFDVPPEMYRFVHCARDEMSGMKSLMLTYKPTAQGLPKHKQFIGGGMFGTPCL